MRETALGAYAPERVGSSKGEWLPGLDVQLVPMTTRGDQTIDRPLAEVGGKGLFLKELEVAMLEGRADAAVHSLKDVPMELDGPFEPSFAFTRDAFVSPGDTPITLQSGQLKQSGAPAPAVR